MRASAPLVVVAMLAARPAIADAVDCEGGLVFTGQGTVDLLSKCGEPSYRDEHIEERSIFVFDPWSQVSEERRVRMTIARWTYDLGPNRLTQFVTIENGKVVAVDRGGYGSAAVTARRGRGSVLVARCDPQLSFNVSDSIYEIFSRCGEPAARDFKQVERRLAAADADGIIYGDSATVDVETWTYNFGPYVFQRRLKFVGGRLVKIATGSYGYR
jgi:hypothetical protein